MQNEDTERLPLSSNGRAMASRLQSIRDILTSDRDSGLSVDEQRAALSVVDSELADRLATEREGNTYDNTVHRLADNGMNDRYSHLLERHGSTSPSSIARSRRRLNRPLDRIQRQTDRMHRLASRSDQQDSSSANHSQLSPLQNSRTRRASDDQDSDMDPHHSREEKSSRKRRKLDDGTAEEIQPLPSYGLEGTLLSGNLNMTVLDIEGNADAHFPNDQIAKVRLALPDNRDVYRTKRNNCDILMKHTGGFPFALSKLVIKIPQREYDAPPLQGMVFISMNRETLLSEASHYNSYFPVSHSHHRRRYDSYRPSVDYMRSTRSPRPMQRHRRLSDHSVQDTPWYDSRLSLSEPTEVPSHPGIKVSLESVVDPEALSPNGPRSPRPWEQDYTRRSYIDRYRPGMTNRARERPYQTTASLSPTSSEDEEDDQTQDHFQSNPDDTEETSYDRSNTTRTRNEARYSPAPHIPGERARYQFHRIPSDPPSQSRQAPETNEDDDSYSAEQLAAIEATLARRGYDIEALRRHARGEEPENSMLTSSRPSSRFRSTKRLPGPAGMLQGQSPHGLSDRDVAIPHATFAVGRENGGGVAVNFAPEVSGVYILVKLWAMCPNSNVAVQSIIPMGYGTVRQMPLIEFR